MVICDLVVPDLNLVSRHVETLNLIQWSFQVITISLDVNDELFFLRYNFQSLRPEKLKLLSNSRVLCQVKAEETFGMPKIRNETYQDGRVESCVIHIHALNIAIFINQITDALNN